MTEQWQPYRRPLVRPSLATVERAERAMQVLRNSPHRHALELAVGQVALGLTRDQLARRVPGFNPGELATPSGRRQFAADLGASRRALENSLRRWRVTADDLQAICHSSQIITQVAADLGIILLPHCAHCGAPLPRYDGHTMGRPRVYCGDRCKKRAERARQADQEANSAPSARPGHL